jgi:two-component system, NarL family, nitrate/nitrite response regulator NarL
MGRIDLSQRTAKAMQGRQNPISIVVADDHPAVLHGVADVLTSHPDMTVVAACNDGASALRAIQQFAPTVAVLDVFMPGLSGLDLLARISAAQSRTKVVFLTATASEAQLFAAIARGAKGIVLKDAPLTEFVQCVRAVAAEGHWLPLDLVDAALKHETRCQSAGQRLAQSLTGRELHLALMVAEGFPNKEIGRRLDLSEATVKIHLHNIYKKLGVNNRTTLAARTITHREELLGGMGPSAGAVALISGCTHPLNVAEMAVNSAWLLDK